MAIAESTDYVELNDEELLKAIQTPLRRYKRSHPAVVEFCNRIRRYRFENCETLDELAARFHVNGKQAISYWILKAGVDLSVSTECVGE